MQTRIRKVSDGNQNPSGHAEKTPSASTISPVKSNKRRSHSAQEDDDPMSGYGQAAKFSRTDGGFCDGIASLPASVPNEITNIFPLRTRAQDRLSQYQGCVAVIVSDEARVLRREFGIVDESAAAEPMDWEMDEDVACGTDFAPGRVDLGDLPLLVPDTNVFVDRASFGCLRQAIASTLSGLNRAFFFYEIFFLTGTLENTFDP